jgi:hypothetical protein
LYGCSSLAKTPVKPSIWSATVLLLSALLCLQEAKQLLADSPNDASLQRLLAELKQAYAKQVEQAVQAAKQQDKPQQSMFEEEQNLEQQQRKQQGSAAGPAAAAAEAVTRVQHHRIVIEDGSESDSEEEDNLQPAAAVQQAPQHENGSNGQQSGSAAASAAAPAAQKESSGGRIAPPAAAAAHGTAKAPTAALTAAVPAAAEAATERLVQQLAQKQPSAPKTAVEFITTAKLLSTAAKGGGSSSEALGLYVRQLDPATYKAVFKRDLSEGLIRWLVQGLQALVSQEPLFVQQALLALSKVERFGMVLPMAAANKGTKAALQGLLDKLIAAGVDMATLRAVYKLR